MTGEDSSWSSGGGVNALWWVSGAFLAAIVIAAVVAIAVTGGGNGRASEQDAATVWGTPPQDEAAPATEQDAGCPLPAGEQAIPVDGPPATWVAYGYAWVPQSPHTFGPGPCEGSRWGCYANSPTGALFAAVNLFAELGEPDYADVANDALVDNSARTAWLENQSPQSRTQAPGEVAQIAGFQFESVREDQVVVAIGFRHADVQAAVRIAVVWDEQASTWRGDLELGDLSPYAQDLAQFTTWSAAGG